MIELTQVSKRFQVGGRTIDAVQPTDLHIPSGEVFGLLGFSGAGKSTLLRLINRLEEPSAGSVRVHGQEMVGLSGDAFHITNDEILTWNQIYQLMAQAAGVDAPKLVHIPSDFIAAFDPDWGAGLLGDKAHSMTFDNTKVRRLVPEFNPTIPFWQGAREIMAYYDEDPAHQVIDTDADAMMDRIIAAYEAAWP